MESNKFLYSNRKYVIGLGIAVSVVLIVLLLAMVLRQQSPKPTPTAEVALVETVTPEPDEGPRECEVVQPSGWVRYTVQEGDNLITLSESRGISVRRIMNINCLTSDLVIAGQPLYLPPVPTPTPCPVTPPFNWTLYSVQTGDTLTSLAGSRGTTVTEIIRVNCVINEDILLIGQNIYLPELPTPTPTATPTVTPLPTLPPAPPTATATLPLAISNPAIVAPGTTAQIRVQPGNVGALGGAVGTPPDTGGPPGGLPPSRNGDGEPEPIISLPDMLKLGMGGGGPGGCANDIGPSPVKATFFKESSPLSSEERFPSSGVKTRRVSMELWQELPLNKPITITLSSFTKLITLSGTFQVKRDEQDDQGTVNWIDPIPFESGSTVIINQDDVITCVDLLLSWPIKLPPGTWFITAETGGKLSLNESFVVPPVGWPELSTDLGAKPFKLRLLKPRSECPFLSTSDMQDRVKIVGTGFPPRKPLQVGIYREVERGEFEIVKDGEAPKEQRVYADNKGNIPSSTSFRVAPLDADSFYFVFAATYDFIKNFSGDNFDDFIKQAIESGSGAVDCFTLFVPGSAPPELGDGSKADEATSESSNSLGQLSPTAQGTSSPVSALEPIEMSADRVAEPAAFASGTDAEGGGILPICLGLVVLGLLAALGILIRRKRVRSV